MPHLCGPKHHWYGKNNAAIYRTGIKASPETKLKLSEALKAKYELAIKEQESKAASQMTNTATNFRKALRDRLFGEGKIGDDMQFAFVTADNLLSTYKKQKLRAFERSNL